MDHSFPGHVGMGVGTAGTAVPHPVHRSDLTGTAEHPDRQGQSGTGHSAWSPTALLHAKHSAPGEELFQALRKFWISFEFWLIYSRVDFTIISFCMFKHSLIFFGRCRRVYS